MKDVRMNQAVGEVEATKVDNKKAEIELALKEFGLELRRIRESKNLKQVDLHEITGIDKTVLSELERGLYTPSLALIKQLADGLEINPHILVSAYYGISLPEFNLRDRETLESFIRLALEYTADQQQPLPPFPINTNNTQMSERGEKALNKATAARRKKKIDKPADNTP